MIPATPSAAPTQRLTPTAAVAVATAPLPTPPPHAPSDHTVRGGDTLLGLAIEWGVPMAAIQLANDLGGSTVVQAGSRLRVPTVEGWEGASPYWILHVVETGETLTQIAQRYAMEVSLILNVNDVADANQITRGQKIIVPLDTFAPPVETVPDTIPTPPSPTPTQPLESTTVLSDQQTMTETASPSPVPAAPPADIADWARETVRIINTIRAQHGLPPYAYNETLALAAHAHASDCVQRGWCSHTGSDGSNVKTRVQRAGYQGSGWAECWAQRQTPQGAVDIWMDEEPPDDPHRRMMLHTWFTEVGVGIAKAPWGYYFIADFGRP